MLGIALFFALALSVQGQSTNIDRCTGSLNVNPPLNVYIGGCINPPCVLHQREDAIVNIIFRAPRAVRSMTTRARAFLFGPIPIPYNLQENAVTCNFLQNSYCPLMEGEVVIYTLRMYIEEFFPVGTNANIEFYVEDNSNGQPLFCLRSAISIRAPRSLTQLAGNNTTHFTG